MHDKLSIGSKPSLSSERGAVMKEVVVEKSTPKVLLMAFGSLLFVLAGFSNFSRGDTASKVFAVLGIFFFGMCLFIFLRTLFRREGMLVINEEGFADNFSMLGISVGFIPWEQVEGVRLSTFLWVSRFISVKIKDARNFEARIPGYVRIWIKLNKFFGYPSVNISLNAAKKTYRYEDVVGIMQGFLDAWREKHGHGDSSIQ